MKILPTCEDILFSDERMYLPNRRGLSSGLTTRVIFSILFPIVVLASIPFRATEKYGERERKIILDMLQTVRNDLHDKYYDPNFHGVDMDARFREAEAKIRDSKSYLEGIVTVEWALDALDDSHTFLIPPPQPFEADYGFRFQFYGNNCYVTEVKKGSDTQKQGLLAGDRLLAIDGQKLIRTQYFQLKRSLETIAPRSKLRLAVMSAGSTNMREMTVDTKISPLPGMDSRSTQGTAFNIDWSIHKFESMEDEIKPASGDAGDVMVWRQPTFLPYTEIHAHVGTDFPPLGDKAELLLDRARKYRAIVLDLRGNTGGPIAGEQWLLGGMFDHDVPLYEVTGRAPSTAEIAKTLGKRAFTGKLIVLVDGNTSSQAETFARVVQLEKRGYVIGDQTAGRVKEAERIHHQEFTAGSTPHYYVSVSTGYVTMSDGKSLEGVGVTPDLLLLPTQADLAAGRDPVLAAAISLAGHPMDPADAGRLLPPK